MRDALAVGDQRFRRADCGVVPAGLILHLPEPDVLVVEELPDGPSELFDRPDEHGVRPLGFVVIEVVPTISVDRGAVDVDLAIVLRSEVPVAPARVDHAFASTERERPYEIVVGDLGRDDRVRDQLVMHQILLILHVTVQPSAPVLQEPDCAVARVDRVGFR